MAVEMYSVFKTYKPCFYACSDFKFQQDFMNIMKCIPVAAVTVSYAAPVDQEVHCPPIPETT
jgi:hypothetical protein